MQRLFYLIILLSILAGSSLYYDFTMDKGYQRALSTQSKSASGSQPVKSQVHLSGVVDQQTAEGFVLRNYRGKKFRIITNQPPPSGSLVQLIGEWSDSGTVRVKELVSDPYWTYKKYLSLLALLAAIAMFFYRYRFSWRDFYFEPRKQLTKPLER